MSAIKIDKTDIPVTGYVSEGITLATAAGVPQISC